MTDDLRKKVKKVDEMQAIIGRKISSAFVWAHGRDPASAKELADWIMTPDGTSALDRELALFPEKDMH